MKTFSKPLTSAQEKIYLHRCQEGDLDAKNILIERNLRLVAHIAKKYQNSGEDLEDLISIGTIGLIKAISTFDHTRCARLSTYAARCIDNELLMMFRSKKKHSREISLYEPIGTDKEGNEISLLDIIERYCRGVFYKRGYQVFAFCFERYAFRERVSGYLFKVWVVWD